MLQEGSGNGSINLELFHDGGASDAEDLGHLGADLLESLLVQEDIRVELVLDLGFGPGLLLCLGTLALVGLGALRGACSFIFDRLLCFSLHSQKQTVSTSANQSTAAAPDRRPQQTLLTIFVVDPTNVY